jgi:tripartite-type tricarboxylate transporter receptor subunit TctC
VKDLIALGRSRPGDLAISFGGSPSQLSAHLFKSMADIDLLLVPYKGNAPAVTAVITGEVSLVFGGLAQTIPLVNAGRLRALAVSGANRSPAMPGVPTVSESGLPGFEVSPWYGVFVPARTPGAIVQQLNAELVKVVQSPAIREQLLKVAVEALADTPGSFAAVVKAEVAKWARVVEESGARIN